MRPVTPEQEAILREIVEAELAPYKKLLSPDMVDFFRREALAKLSAHPYPIALLRQLTVEPEVKISGTMGPEGEEEVADPAVSNSGRGGVRR
jgi:hypothetical protein